MKCIHHTFRGKRYRIRFVAPDGMDKPSDFGQCDARTTKNPTILIRDNQQARNLLDSLVHESLHAANFDLSEQCVSETAIAVSSLLWKLGYRR